MSRLIDADKIQFSEIDEIGGEYEPYLGCSKSQIDNLPTVEAIPKADYENRLKADMVAMLTELQAVIEEKATQICDDGWWLSYNWLIQQKINEVAVSSELEKNFGESDCISRKRAIERLKLNFPISQGADNSRDRHRYMQALADMQAIRELPSVTPQEPRKGHWMNKQRLFDSCSAECSSCHKRSNGYMHDNGFSLASMYYDFCPKCGARMVEPQESEETDG
jgi:hypothetical protein